jgi:hypothetical protein
MSLVYVLNDPAKHGIEGKTFVLTARRGEHFSFKSRDEVDERPHARPHP